MYGEPRVKQRDTDDPVTVSLIKEQNSLAELLDETRTMYKEKMEQMAKFRDYYANNRYRVTNYEDLTLKQQTLRDNALKIVRDQRTGRLYPPPNLPVVESSIKEYEAENVALKKAIIERRKRPSVDASKLNTKPRPVTSDIYCAHCKSNPQRIYLDKVRAKVFCGVPCQKLYYTVNN